MITKKNLTLVLINFLALNFFAVGMSCAQAQTAQPEQSVTVDYQGRPQKVTYDFYLPPAENTERIPVLVCIGGLPMDGEKYIRSDTGECLDAVWKNFADRNHIAILGLGFLFIPEDWKTKTSYQYPAAWSGEGLSKILKMVSEQFSIDPNELYFWGVSAGAQFSIRFAQLHPKIVKAVAAHAAGGYDLPEEFLPTKFLITVGRFDNKEITRREMAVVFARACRFKKIDLTLRIIPGIAHRQTEEQNVMSREFFHRILSAGKNFITP